VSAIITQLIDKQDNFEIIRDQIAAILALEIANQRALAVSDGKTNPDSWNFAVYRERSNPWQALDDDNGKPSGDMVNGLVNVFYQDDEFENGGSNPINYQRSTGTFIIDAYAHKNRRGSTPGDELASLEADRIGRLVRNIIMYSQYTYLELRSIVEGRYFTRREKLQPDIRDESAHGVIVMRQYLRVNYTESSFDVPTVDLDLLTSQCTFGDSGEVLVDFDYTES
jgi:hypothetical protein